MILSPRMSCDYMQCSKIITIPCLLVKAFSWLYHLAIYTICSYLGALHATPQDATLSQCPESQHFHTLINVCLGLLDVDAHAHMEHAYACERPCLIPNVACPIFESVHVAHAWLRDWSLCCWTWDGCTLSHNCKYSALCFKALQSWLPDFVLIVQSFSQRVIQVSNASQY